MEGSSSEENDIGGYSSEEEEEDEDYDYDAFEDDEDDNDLDEPNFQRMTSKQIGREYSYLILDPIRCFSILQTKIVAIKDRFEYLNLSDSTVLENLRNNHFLVENTVESINDQIEKLMSSAPKPVKLPDEVMCMIDFMPVGKHQANHLGCGHMVCNECWQDYITQKVAEGPSAIHTRCPMPDCKLKVSVEMVDELVPKQTADR